MSIEEAIIGQKIEEIATLTADLASARAEVAQLRAQRDELVGLLKTMQEYALVSIETETVNAYAGMPCRAPVRWDVVFPKVRDFLAKLPK